METTLAPVNSRTNLIVIVAILLALILACNDSQENEVDGTDNGTDNDCTIEQDGVISSDYE